MVCGLVFRGNWPPVKMWLSKTNSHRRLRRVLNVPQIVGWTMADGDDPLSARAIQNLCFQLGETCRPMSIAVYPCR